MGVGLSSITDIGESVSSKFNYGLNPSLIMWEAEEGGTYDNPDVEDETSGDNSVKDPADAASSAKTFHTYKFDAVAREEHSAMAEITKLPVSSGFIVSDHSIKRNRVLKLAVCTANMVNETLWVGTVAGAIGAVGDVASIPLLSLVGSATALAQTMFETEDRVANAYKLFSQLMADGTRLYVNTILGPYSNCVVTGIEVVQDSNTSTIFAAEITMEELQVVEPSETDLAARSILTNQTDYSQFVSIAESYGLYFLGQAV
jgi:hypothetical protein